MDLKLKLHEARVLLELVKNRPYKNVSNFMELYMVKRAILKDKEYEEFYKKLDDVQALLDTQLEELKRTVTEENKGSLESAVKLRMTEANIKIEKIYEEYQECELILDVTVEAPKVLKDYLTKLKDFSYIIKMKIIFMSYVKNLSNLLN